MVGTVDQDWDWPLLAGLDKDFNLLARRYFELREEVHMQAILDPQSLADASQQDLISEMLVRLGEDSEHDGLENTPKRVERSMQHLTRLLRGS